MTNAAGSHAGFFAVAEWQGPANSGDSSIIFSSFAWVELSQDGIISGTTNITAQWSWPIYESMFWPGAEIGILDAAEVNWLLA